MMASSTQFIHIKTSCFSFDISVKSKCSTKLYETWWITEAELIETSHFLNFHFQRKHRRRPMWMMATSPFLRFSGSIVLRILQPKLFVYLNKPINEIEIISQYLFHSGSRHQPKSMQIIIMNANAKVFLPQRNHNNDFTIIDDFIRYHYTYVLDCGAIYVIRVCSFAFLFIFENLSGPLFRLSPSSSSSSSSSTGKNTSNVVPCAESFAQTRTEPYVCCCLVAWRTANRSQRASRMKRSNKMKQNSNWFNSIMKRRSLNSKLDLHSKTMQSGRRKFLFSFAVYWH